jgi:hypothetical protein
MRRPVPASIIHAALTAARSHGSACFGHRTEDRPDGGPDGLAAPASVAANDHFVRILKFLFPLLTVPSLTSLSVSRWSLQMIMNCLSLTMAISPQTVPPSSRPGKGSPPVGSASDAGPALGGSQRCEQDGGEQGVRHEVGDRLGQGAARGGGDGLPGGPG